MLVSIVIRTLNEERYLEELLSSISKQKKINFDVEVVLVDSGSEDNTLSIAKKYESKITFIKKEEFTFGKSLNIGSEFSNGDILVYISGHCIPVNDLWLSSLIKPILENKSGYTYGRQIGRDTTKFSETQIFKKYFPKDSKIPQKGFFCNNANSAISKKIWQRFKFDEKVTGLEDMELAKRYTQNGGDISYVASAQVFHIHDETWAQTRRRYEREALAMQSIMPEIQMNFFDMLRYILASIITDSKEALYQKVFLNEFISIIKFRIAQFGGSYLGNHFNRVTSKKRKESYYYPTKKI